MSELHDQPHEPDVEPELFVDFANTSRLADPDRPDPDRELPSLGDWLTRRGYVAASPSRARLARHLPAFRDLRALVRAVAARAERDRPPTREQVAAINRVMRDGLHYHSLRAERGGARFSVTQVGDELDQARSAVAGSLAHYLADHDQSRLRVCDGCTWLFVDRSPAGRRRWCDMSTCGNRAKVARHRARARADGSVRPRSGARPS